jgi:hypothetical protein
MRLGAQVMRSVVGYETMKTRPRRWVINSPTECFWAMLYHPEELEEVHRTIDDWLRVCGTKRISAIPSGSKKFSWSSILVSAFFHDLDVTSRIREIIRAHGSGYLVLTPPVKTGSRKQSSARPSTIKWWYTRLFGDPAPGVKKTLVLTARHPKAAEEALFAFSENTPVRMKFGVSTAIAKTRSAPRSSKKQDRTRKAKSRRAQCIKAIVGHEDRSVS